MIMNSVSPLDMQFPNPNYAQLFYLFYFYCKLPHEHSRLALVYIIIISEGEQLDYNIN